MKRGQIYTINMKLAMPCYLAGLSLSKSWSKKIMALDHSLPNHGQVKNSEISEMSEISRNYLRVIHLRVFVLALYA